MKRLLRHSLCCIGLAATALVASAASAQPSPDVVRIVVPFPAGNALDASARMLAESLRRITQRQYFVENKPGAGGLIGTAEVARAKPDGSVLLFTTGGHSTNAVLYTKLPYDSLRDFTPITLLTSAPGFVVLVRTDSPYKDLGQLIKDAHARPGTVSYASWGTGNTTHLIGELFARSAGIKVLHVPYKASPISDILGGHVDYTFMASSLAVPLIQEGKARALAISSEQRVKEMPAVPTLRELGIKDVDIPAWSGLLAPAGLSLQAAAVLQREVAAAAQRPEYQAFLKTSGGRLVLSTPVQFSSYLASEIQNYRKQLAPLGIRMD